MRFDLHFVHRWTDRQTRHTHTHKQTKVKIIIPPPRFRGGVNNVGASIKYIELAND